MVLGAAPGEAAAIRSALQGTAIVRVQASRVEGGEVGPRISVIPVARIQALANVGRALKKRHAPAEPATPTLPGGFWNLSFCKTPRIEPLG
jgi:hypothetical protein